MKDSLENRTEARILEWVGMCRHLRYDLAGAIKCYEECSDLEPENVSCQYYEAIKKCEGEIRQHFQNCMCLWLIY